MSAETARLVGRRLLFMVPILFGIVTITFVVTRIIPGDPAYLVAGNLATPEQVDAAREKLGLSGSVLSQYWDYLSGVVHGDFGTSIFTQQSVMSDLMDRLPSTLELIVLSLLVSLLIGVPLGVWAARQRERIADRAIRGGSFVFIAMPDFWLGLLLLYVFFYLLGWAPAYGQIGVDQAQPSDITGAAFLDSIITGNGPALWASFQHLILPVMTLALIFSAAIMRLTRSAMIEVLEADYIRFGRACGLSGRTQLRYALRGSLPPIVTFAASLFAALVGGVVLVEVVFSWNGAAQYAANAILNKDYPAVQGFVLISGVISVVVFLVVDLLYAAIDPRVRL